MTIDLTSTDLEQGELDLDGVTLESQWRRNELAQAQDWSDEALCIQWVWPKTNWRAHKDWWDGLPSYERDSLLSSWRLEQTKHPSARRTCLEIDIDCDAFSKHVDELASVWAVDIRQAAMQRKPIPIAPVGVLGKCAYEKACDLAGILVITSAKAGRQCDE